MNNQTFFVDQGFSLKGKSPKATGFVDRVKPKGWIRAQIIRKDGRIEEVPLSQNGITDSGYNDFLNVHFHDTTQRTAWYIGLISNSGFSVLANADTMSSHAGWNESVAYTQTTRTQWSNNSAASKSITNTTTSDYNINADGTVIKGIFVCSDNTKSGTAGQLWSTGLFSSDQTLNNGDILKVTYTVNLS